MRTYKWYSFVHATQKKIIKADAYVAACDVPGIKRLLPKNWRESQFFDNIYQLVGVPIVTMQLRCIGWVTELRDLERARQLRQAAGLDNLLYTPDVDFSCFADLALSSPEDYYLEGQGSLLQCVLTPRDPYMPLPNDEIIKRVAKQVGGACTSWMKNLTKEECINILRCKSTGFFRGSSKYRGITLDKYGHQEARMCQFLGKK
ncbi:hypothetical protein ACS0TY_003968 [Phlomoides rotata]